MINGVHFLLYSNNAEADRAFVRDVLGFKAVDVGGGWLIFGLPPAEMGVHPGDGKFVQSHAEHSLLGAVMYLMCDDLRATVAELRGKGVECSAAMKADWGITTTVPLPSGGRLGLYQPKHATAIG
jgi:catechol 2,3-dioxygenase-like lactoylglutathione lyase family enzyme